MSVKGQKETKHRQQYRKTYVDITGKKFNLLTPIFNSRKNGRWYWTCKCDCGNETTLRADAIIQGRTVSCGCKKGTSPYGSGKPKGESQLNSLVSSYILSARKRKIKFDLTLDQFRDLVAMDCYYCKNPPKTSRFNTKNNNEFKSNGIDRVDNQVGYTFANCVPCCKFCNFAKNVMTDDEFTQWVRRVYFNYARDNKFNQMNIDFGD